MSRCQSPQQPPHGTKDPRSTEGVRVQGSQGQQELEEREGHSGCLRSEKVGAVEGGLTGHNSVTVSRAIIAASAESDTCPWGASPT